MLFSHPRLLQASLEGVDDMDEISDLDSHVSDFAMNNIGLVLCR